jgi:signal transduction histidine kinase
MGGHATATPVTDSIRVLLVEDNLADAELVKHELQRGGFQVITDLAQNGAELKDRLGSAEYDIILADYSLPDCRGMDALEVVQQQGKHTPVILVTGALGDVTAVECIKQGATDYVLKDNLARLRTAVRRAMNDSRLVERQKQSEKQLAESAQELARSNRELEQFAYVASHDLQEPLRMVANYTQLLADRYQGKLDRDADKYIRYAVEGAVRMQTLIQDLLAYSRTGRGGLRVKTVDVNLVMREAAHNLRAAIEESRATVNIGHLPSLTADPSQLVQLFQNLMGNAIKFRGSEPPVITISARHQGNLYTFSVADNGIGIAPEHLEHIFVIFQRLHTHAEYPGNGIGLSICKKIVEQHGGKIWVESHPGQGSTFHFTLPMNQPHQESNHDGPC